MIEKIHAGGERGVSGWKLVLAYDGTDFHGWQVQPDRVTVQGTLADAIERITGERVLPQGSGRTDAGVHALGQVVSFALAAAIPATNFHRALNRALPASIRVLETAANAAGRAAAASSSATGVVAPSQTAVARLFSSVLAPSAARMLTGKLESDLPSAGRLTIAWRVATGAHMLVARGSAAATSAGRALVRLKFTRRGRSLLKHHTRVKLLVTATFTPVGGAVVTDTRKLTLKR